MVIKLVDNEGVVVILSNEYSQSLIMQHVLDENIYRKLEPKWKFLNTKDYELSNSYRIPKTYKSKITESTLNLQNNKLIEFVEPKDLKLRPIVDGSNCPSRRISQLID